jgi:hypothetical protein
MSISKLVGTTPGAPGTDGALSAADSAGHKFGLELNQTRKRSERRPPSQEPSQEMRSRRAETRCRVVADCEAYRPPGRVEKRPRTYGETEAQRPRTVTDPCHYDKKKNSVVCRY